MSWQPADEAECDMAPGCPALDAVIVPRAHDIGGLEVRRALPTRERKMVGPFIFYDQMGPAILKAGGGLDVRPHPHIGLSTVTYLFDGEIMHRDSLGSEQAIQPGAVNWMTAGSGIVHSERTRADRRDQDNPLFGIQTWIAHPEKHEEVDPAFFHHSKESLPFLDGEGKEVRLIAGSLFGKTSPVKTWSDMFYADAKLEAGASLSLPADYEERAIAVVTGEIDLRGDKQKEGALLVFKPGDEIHFTATVPSRVMLLGGEPMDSRRYIWWNFVSSSKERLEQAKEDWKEGRFAKVPGETEFIPLPDK